MEVSSIDFFDTLVTRDVYKPTDLFYFVGKKASKELNLGITPEFFKLKRIEAEAIARKIAKRKGKEEISIIDIYKTLMDLINLNSEIISKIIDIEITTELNSIFPIAENLKNLDKDTIIVSDSYLDKKILIMILEKLKINNYLDLFVSSEIGKTKSSGNLYKYLQTKFTLKKHLGDNEISDFKVPRKLGIKAEKYRNSRPSRYERAVYSLDNIDYELKCTLSGAMKVARLYLHYDNEHLQTIHTVSTNVIGPFLFSYVYWVLYNAKKLGLEKLFFLSRDGQILYEIARIVSKNTKMFNNIEMKYIYVSRKTLYLPAIANEFDIKTLPKVLDLKDFEKEFGTPPNQNALTIAEDKRRRVLSYLLQEGFHKNSRIGIVDVGWRGRLQFCISRILDLNGIYNGITGFYVGLINPVPKYKKDVRFTFFDPHSNYNILSAPLIETFCSATHGLTLDYEYRDGKFYPVLKEEKNSEMLNWGLEVQQNSIKLFCDFFMNNIVKYDVDLSLEDLRKVSEVVLNLFINIPTKMEAQVYGIVAHYPDVNEKIKYSLAKKLEFLDIVRLLIGVKKFKFGGINERILWREGTIVLSLPTLMSNLFLMLLRLRKSLEKRILIDSGKKA